MTTQELQPLFTLDDLLMDLSLTPPVYVHKDHRWVLPLVYHAQRAGNLPTPCTLISFDRHHDGHLPQAMREIEKLASDGLTMDGLINLCDKHLRKDDSDWILAGMELGIFGDAVIFGPRDDANHGTSAPDQYIDHRQGTHQIESAGLPGGGLGFQGRLSDLAYQDAYASLWEILGWEYGGDHRFRFAPDRPKLALTIDLDLFVVTWDGYHFPWPDEVFESRFLQASNYFSTEGWSGRLFLDGLREKAGGLFIAREPDYCGGKDKCHEILRKVNQFLLAGAATFAE